MTLSRRFNNLKDGHVFTLGALALVLAFTCITLSPANARDPAFDGNARVHDSQVIGTINSNIAIVNFTAPNFTWLGPIIFNFTIDSNVSVTIDITIHGSIFSAEQTNFTISSPGLYNVVIIKEPDVLAVPGYKEVSFLFSVGLDSASIIHHIWLGSTMVIALIMIAGTIMGSTAIIIKFKDPGSASGISSSSGSSGSMSTPVTSGSGFPSMDEDDTSTMTYVDQSRAPPGQIYCPECRKLIEEGSIFCPECGTRIPRYLRYRPDH
ncbi:MAG: zinc ribbon domain-containing protein [Promethearchaeota archaeon]